MLTRGLNSVPELGRKAEHLSKVDLVDVQRLHDGAGVVADGSVARLVQLDATGYGSCTSDV